MLSNNSELIEIKKYKSSSNIYISINECGDNRFLQYKVNEDMKIIIFITKNDINALEDSETTLRSLFYESEYKYVANSKDGSIERIKGLKAIEIIDDVLENDLFILNGCVKEIKNKKTEDEIDEIKEKVTSISLSKDDKYKSNKELMLEKELKELRESKPEGYNSYENIYRQLFESVYNVFTKKIFLWLILNFAIIAFVFYFSPPENVYSLDTIGTIFSIFTFVLLVAFAISMVKASFSVKNKSNAKTLIMLSIIIIFFLISIFFYYFSDLIIPLIKRSDI